MSWGSSSMLAARSTLPTRVTRGSAVSFLRPSLGAVPAARSAMYCRCIASDAPVCMVRNFQTRNGVCSCPSRSWRKNTGPRESSRTAIATTRNSGESSSNPNPAPARSISRLQAAQNGNVRPLMSESVDMGASPPAEKPASQDPTPEASASRRQLWIPRGEGAAATAIGAGAAGLVIWLSFESGGFFPGTTALAALIVLGVLLVFATTARRPAAGLRPRLAIGIAVLALYSLWQLISSSWSHAPGRAALASDLTLLYVLVTATTGLMVTTSTRV